MQGWWVGHISEANDGFKCKAFFGNTSEEIDFEHIQLKPHQNWIKDKWIAALKYYSYHFSLSASFSCFLPKNLFHFLHCIM